MNNTSVQLPNFGDVISANDRIMNLVVRTPLIRSPHLDTQTGKRCFIKPEVLQVAGSFKFRGASNRLLQLTEEERKLGVVAWSSGNHAQGVAAAAQAVGIKATIVMPADAPAMKIANTKRLGGDVVLYDRYTESREEIAKSISSETGAIIVPSFDDPQIIAGQGTAGLEFAKQVEAQCHELDAFLICCGGGGLTAGCALAFDALSPNTKVYTVEPSGYDDHARSFVSGERETNSGMPSSICDALLAPQPGALTFEINKQKVTSGLVVSEQEVRRAVSYAFHKLKLVVEPGGAVALAAVLAGKVPAEHQNIGIMMSGGNIDPALFSDIIKEFA